jgi:hypothetical protein
VDGHRDSVFLSLSKREPEKPLPYPGPSQYDPQDIAAIGKIPPLVRASRIEKMHSWVDHSKADVPPPDAYQSLKMTPGKGRTISRIGREDHPNDVPGPGTYEITHGPIVSLSKNACAPQVPPEAID